MENKLHEYQVKIKLTRSFALLAQPDGEIQSGRHRHMAAPYARLSTTQHAALPPKLGYWAGGNKLCHSEMSHPPTLFEHARIYTNQCGDHKTQTCIAVENMELTQNKSKMGKRFCFSQNKTCCNARKQYGTSPR